MGLRLLHRVHKSIFSIPAGQNADIMNKMYKEELVMKNRIAQFEALFDKEWFEKHTLALYRMERLQTFPAYQKGA